MSNLTNRTEEIVVVCDICGFKSTKQTARCPSCKQTAPTIVAQTALPDQTPPIGTAEEASEISSRHQNESKSKTESSRPWGTTAKKRILAAAIDHGAVGLITFVFSFPFFFAGAFSMLTAHADRYMPYGLTFAPSATLVISFIGFLFGVVMFPLLYFACFESSRMQATPGKKLVGLKNFRTDGGKVLFKSALQKSFLQGLMLYFISICAAIPAAFLVLFVSSNILQSLIYLAVDFVLASMVMCLPIFNHRRQSLLDKLVGRVVLPDTADGAALSIGNATPRVGLWQKTRVVRAVIYWIGFGLTFLAALIILLLAQNSEHNQMSPAFILSGAALIIMAVIAWESNNPTCLKILKTALSGAAIVGIVAGLAIALPFDIALLQKASMSIPLAQKAFELDRDGVSPESQKYIKQSQKIFPDLWCIYGMNSRTLANLGFKKESQEMRYQSVVLGAHGDGSAVLLKENPVITHETRKRFEANEKSSSEVDN